MKKLLLLCLVLLGGVMQVSADNVTRRIVAETQGNLTNSWDGWKEGPHIHVFYNNGTEDVSLTGAWWSTSMYYLGEYTDNSTPKKIYYADVTADEAVFENYDLTIIIAGKQDNDNYNRITVTKRYSADQIFYLYIDGTVKYSQADLVYYLVNTSGTKLADLTYSNGVATGTYSNSSDTYAYLAPNYALYYTSGNPSGIRNKKFVYIPKNSGSDYLVNNFSVYSDELTGTDKCFKFAYVGDMELSFNTVSSPSSFTITPYRTTSINSTAGYTTWSNGEKYKIDNTNVDDVYVVSADNNKTVTLTSVKNSTFPAGEGVIIKGSGEVKINAVASDASTSSMGTNHLVGSGNSTATPGTGNNIYVFSWNGSDASTVGFYKASGGTLAAHKAYLQLPISSLANEFLGFDFGETTGIANIDVNDNANFNADSPMYNLAGQRVGKNYKGVVIVNGKKMLNK